MNLQPFESVLARNSFADSALIEEGARQFERLLEEVRAEEEAAAEKARQEAREAFLKRLGSKATKPVAKPEPEAPSAHEKPANVIGLKATDQHQPTTPEDDLPSDRTLRWALRRQQRGADAWVAANQTSYRDRNASLYKLIRMAQTSVSREEIHTAQTEALEMVQSETEYRFDDRLLSVMEAWGGDFRKAAEDHFDRETRRGIEAIIGGPVKSPEEPSPAPEPCAPSATASSPHLLNAPADETHDQRLKRLLQMFQMAGVGR